MTFEEKFSPPLSAGVRQWSSVQSDPTPIVCCENHIVECTPFSHSGTVMDHGIVPYPFAVQDSQ